MHQNRAELTCLIHAILGKGKPADGKTKKRKAPADLADALDQDHVQGLMKDRTSSHLMEV